MADAAVETLLRESKFFSQLPGEHLDQLAKLCRTVEIPANERLFNQGAVAKDVFVILSGEVSLVLCEPKNSCRQIAKLGDGELVGWSPLIGRPRLSAAAVALSPVKALVFDGEELMKFAASDAQFGFEFMKRAAATLAERLSGTRMQLLEMCGVHFPEYDLQPESD